MRPKPPMTAVQVRTATVGQRSPLLSSRQAAAAEGMRSPCRQYSCARPHRITDSRIATSPIHKRNEQGRACIDRVSRICIAETTTTTSAGEQPNRSSLRGFQHIGRRVQIVHLNLQYQTHALVKTHKQRGASMRATLTFSMRYISTATALLKYDGFAARAVTRAGSIPCAAAAKPAAE